MLAARNVAQALGFGDANRPFLVGGGERDPGLDFLRAMAIVLVLIRHFLDRNKVYDPVIPQSVVDFGLFGWAGVDLFFVLSGYLIFSGIFRLERDGAFSMFVFYKKGIYRIWPAYFASLAVCLALGIFAVAPADYVYFLFFLQNYAGPLSDLNGGIYWSLAVEEHFYIVAPLLLIAIVALKRHRLWLLLALLAVPLVLRFAIYWLFVGSDMHAFYFQLYFPTHARFDSLAAGVLCAYLVHSHRTLLHRPLVKVLLPPVCVVLMIGAYWSTASLSL